MYVYYFALARSAMQSVDALIQDINRLSHGKKIAKCCRYPLLDALLHVVSAKMVTNTQ